MDKPLTNHMGLPNEPGYNDVEPDMTPRREGGMESFAESDPRDPRNDEKVIVVERSNSERTEAPGDATGNNSAPRSTEDSDSSR
ncbi:MAG: hypothetical protein EOO15_16200 [Chitinophagaceae bacterium]|nr:MAG: hypothetical protein EOO15_16200 [Chitinophagaceae bacterium]